MSLRLGVWKVRFLDFKRIKRQLFTVLVGVILAWAFVLALARYYVPGDVIASTFDARFEWDLAHGFRTFQIEASSAEPVGGRCWQDLIGLQVKPALASYLRRGRFERARGNALVRVARVVPVALPESWGSGGLILDTDVTPLMQATDKADLNSIKRLLAEGADVNSKDSLGRTPLLHALEHGNINLAVLQTLLAARADVNARDKGGLTPLSAAVTVAWGNDRVTIIRELLAAGADINAKNIAGATALMQAAAVGDTQAVQLLLEKGADANACTATGESALSWAEQHNQIQVIELLRRAGAKR